MNIRIIPKLDIKGPNLVKGVNFEGLRVLGKPWDFACTYYDEGADELIFQDVVASLYGRNNLLDIVEKTAKNIFIPLTVGGGIRSLDDIKQLLRVGADKVCINTAAVQNPSLISEASEMFGSQCIVIAIEAKKMNDGTYEAFVDNGRQRTGKNAFEWAKKATKLGCGEILICSIDRDGTGEGYDLELIRKISQSVSVPVIASGGAASYRDFSQAIESGADAVCASSLFHYHYLTQMINYGDFKNEGNIDYLKFDKNQSFYSGRSVHLMSIKDTKKKLFDSGIPCRYQERQ